MLIDLFLYLRQAVGVHGAAEAAMFSLAYTYDPAGRCPGPDIVSLLIRFTTTRNGFRRHFLM